MLAPALSKRETDAVDIAFDINGANDLYISPRVVTAGEQNRRLISTGGCDCPLPTARRQDRGVLPGSAVLEIDAPPILGARRGDHKAQQGRRHQCTGDS